MDLWTLLLLCVGFWVGKSKPGVVNVTSIASFCDSTTSILTQGGMSGYSLALTDIDTNGHCYLFVGSPWNSQVDLYQGTVTLTPVTISNDITQRYPFNLTAAVKDPTYGPTVNNIADLVVKQTTINQVTSVTWSKSSSLFDNYNGTYPNQPYSLFGSSIAVTSTADYVVVGIPGKSYDNGCVISSSNDCNSNQDVFGSIRMYQQSPLGSGKFVLLTNPGFSSSTFIQGTAQNGNSGDIFLRNMQYGDRFGTQVLFSSDSGSTFLFVAAAAGWAGSENPINFASDLNNLGTTFPTSPTNSTSNLGVYVFKRSSPGGSFSYLQFLPCTSIEPLGITGPVMSFSGNSTSNMILAVRDRSSASLAPNMGGSYPCVNLYKINNSTNLFYQYAQISTQINYKGNQYNYHSEDLFGVGMGFSFTFDTTYSIVSTTVTNPITGVVSPGAIVQQSSGNVTRYTLCIGAPRGAEGVYVFEGYLDVNQQMYTPGTGPLKFFPNVKDGYSWTLKQFLPNTFNGITSYFGGKQVLTRSGKFLLVADATSKIGKGMVHLYHRNSFYEDVYMFENQMNDSAFTQSFKDGQPILGFNQNMYTRIATFVKPADRFHSTFGFAVDHFGVSMVVNSVIAVIGAPVEGCTYTFALPPTYFINRTLPSPQRMNSYNPPNSDLMFQDEAPNQAQTAYINLGLAAGYGFLAAILSMVFFGPPIWYIIRLINKSFYLNALNAMSSKMSTGSSTQFE